MDDLKVAFGLIEAAEASKDKPIFMHELSSERVWWHYGECFPDTETCTVPNRADIDATAH